MIIGSLRHALSLLTLATFAALPVWAAHPLNTDDMGVQGAGNYQLELTLDRSRDGSGQVLTRIRTLAITLSYGVTESADLVLGVPHLHADTNDAAVGSRQVERGKGDANLQLKWRFYEVDGWSFGLKPWVTFRNGDVNRGLGTGKYTYSLLSIATLERELWSWHFNLGYTRNDEAVNPAAIRKNLFLASVALFHQSAEKLRLVGDLGVSTSGNRDSNSYPTYVLAGLTYSPTKDLDLDVGLQFGANRIVDDRVVKIGMTFRW